MVEKDEDFADHLHYYMYLQCLSLETTIKAIYCVAVFITYTVGPHLSEPLGPS